MTVTLPQRALNRATLARQHLLERSTMPALELVAHLYGLQAQAPMAPYFALWCRLKDFVPEQLSDLLLSREVVRIGCMRGTVHALVGDDAETLRALTQPILTRNLHTNVQWGQALTGMDFDELARFGRKLVAEQPLPLPQLRSLLGAQWPDRDPVALANATRDLLPLVQVPPRGIWGKSGQPTLTTLENWLKRTPRDVPAPEQMLLRYLAAYGPASVMDVQAWSGLTRLGEVMDRLRPQLTVFKAESGVELFDLPDSPRPDAGVSAPVRLLAPFDSLLLSHADRSRIMKPEYKQRLFTINGIIKPAVLVNGQVVGSTAITRSKSAVVLDISLFEKVAKTHTAEAEHEGLRLLKFAHPDAASYDVRVVGD